MLEGITVLSQHTYTYEVVSIILKVVSVAAIIVSIYFTVCILRYKEYSGLVPCAFLFGLCCLMFYTSFTFHEQTIYKVTIEDSVPLNVFNEGYEIIDIDGEIYTIKEKVYDRER